MTKITGFDTFDIRFPTSRTLAGSDAMNPAPDYSAAYVAIRTDAADPALAGHGFAFTIGRGNDVQLAAIRLLEPFLAGPAAWCTWPPARSSTRAGTWPPAARASRCGCCWPS
jgi:L-alanine-DL-glutamate epimerase-like enolase superfamily enzyme